MRQFTFLRGQTNIIQLRENGFSKTNLFTFGRENIMVERLQIHSNSSVGMGTTSPIVRLSLMETSTSFNGNVITEVHL